MPISACASIVQVPNSEPAIVRAGILAEFAMDNRTHVIIGANDFAKISRYRPVIVDGSDEEGIS